MEPPFSGWWQIHTLYWVLNQVKKTLKKKKKEDEEKGCSAVRRGCFCWRLNEAGRESSANTLEEDSWGVQRPWGYSLLAVRHEAATWAEAGARVIRKILGVAVRTALASGKWQQCDFTQSERGRHLGLRGAVAWSDSALKDCLDCWIGNGQEGARSRSRRWQIPSLDGRWQWRGLGVIEVQMVRPGHLKGPEKSYRYKPLLVFLLLSNVGCNLTEHHLGDAALKGIYFIPIFLLSCC